MSDLVYYVNYTQPALESNHYQSIEFISYLEYVMRSWAYIKKFYC